MEVAGDLGAGVLQGQEFVEGHHDKPGAIVLLLRGHQLWLRKRNGICTEAATGSGKKGTDTGRARREGNAGVGSRGGERPEEEREEAVAVLVDGRRHGFHAILWMTISKLNTMSINYLQAILKDNNFLEQPTCKK